MSIYKFFALIFPLLLIISVVGCSKGEKTRLELALNRAGKNKIELQNVLDHYEKDMKDSLRYKAACFLIENMPLHSFYEGEILDKYSNIYEDLIKTKDPQYTMDLYNKKYGYFDQSLLKRKEDIKVLKSEYIINNIEWAFKVWEEQPWGKSISFDTFCNFILPYRVDKEQPIEWRKFLYEKYNPLLNEFKKSNDSIDPLKAALLINSILCKEDKFFTTIASNIPLKNPLLIERFRTGSCRDMSSMMVYVLRALGIPCGLDFMPLEARSNTGHSWAFILDKDENTFASDYLDCNILPSYNNRYFTSKVYREIFSLNTTLLNEMSEYEGSFPPFFKDPMFVDVTDKYDEKTMLSVQISDNYWYDKKEQGILYLCASQFRKWIPIDWGIIKNNTINFNRIKPSNDILYNEKYGFLYTDVIYRLASWEDSNLILLTDPFILKKDGTTEFLTPNEKNKSSICVYSKYSPLSDHFVQHMLGGYFEVADNINFSNSDTIFEIQDLTFRLFNRIDIDSDKQYQFIRYKGADGTYCSISEILVYGDSETEILKGKPIGSINGFEIKDHGYVNAFDGDPYTSFYSSNASGDWVGLNLGKPFKISSIIYVPRNRDNYIRIGDKYELFYLQKNRWISLGKQIAVSDSILFHNVPSNTLFYLRDHTRGKDERIFTYKNGSQLWW